MFNTAIRMISNKMDAEDITQEVFIKVFRNLQHFKGEATLGSWIKRITINTTLNFIRKQGKLPLTELDEYYEIPVIPVRDDEPFDMGAIHQAVKELPQGCRIVFNLYMLEGYQHKEVAKMLNITESTSKTQYRRAKKLLQKRLKLKYYERE